MKAKTKDVKLRPIRLADAPRYVKWLNDPEITRFLSRSPGITLAEEKAWIRNAKKDKSKKVFAITYRGRHIGSVSLDHLVKSYKKASFGIFIGEQKFQNMGIGTIATRKILAYGFNALKLHKISLQVMPKNKQAIKVYRRLGFRREGYLKDEIVKKSKYRDIILMAKIKK